MASLPSKIVIAAGTYDGVLAGWELDVNRKLVISFASPVHDGSLRSLSMSNNIDSPAPGALLSCGYDEMLRTHDFSKRLTSSGEVRTPADLGTPVCSSFAPPTGNSTHCLVGFSSGKLVIYKKRDWIVQHVLAGHDGGVSALAVHPSGKMALTGGASDGKLKLWDLTKGRLSFAIKIQAATKGSYDPILSLVWTGSGEAFCFCYGSHVTVRAVASGTDLLDVELPSRVNQVCLITGESDDEQLFVVAACNDGSLPVLAVQQEGNGNADQIRAMMAIEPVDGPVAGEERFKCIVSVVGSYVVTANSAGVVSLMNLQGAVNMILKEDDDDDDDDKDSPSDQEDESSDEDEEVDLAVEIIDSIQLGTGARITCLAAWSANPTTTTPTHDTSSSNSDDEEQEEKPNVPKSKREKAKAKQENDMKRKRAGNEVVMDDDTIQKARDLVKKAKKIQKRKDRKNKKAQD
jgi:protein MAK11